MQIHVRNGLPGIEFSSNHYGTMPTDGGPIRIGVSFPPAYGTEFIVRLIQLTIETKEKQMPSSNKSSAGLEELVKIAELQQKKLKRLHILLDELETRAHKNNQSVSEAIRKRR